MDVAYSAASRDELDRPAYEAQAERPDKPVRLRIQPTLLRTEGQHQAWPGVSWTVECQDAEETIAVREALRAFFEALGVQGPVVLATELQLLTGKPVA